MNLRIFVFTTLCLIAVMVAAQAPSKPESPAPALGTAERIALQACEKAKQDAQKQWQDAAQQEQAVFAEFAASHPGYHVNANNFAVEADLPKAAPAPAITPTTKK